MQPRPADQLQMPPTGSKDSLAGQVYSVPITWPFTMRAQVMNFLHEYGCGKLPWSRQRIVPLLVRKSLLSRKDLPATIGTSSS